MNATTKREDLIQKVGNIFFSHRSYASLPLFALFLLFGRSSVYSFVLALPLIFFGELIRLWAVSFAGPSTRTRTIGAESLVTDGPYELIRHPIYFGNFFMGLGFVLSMTESIAHISIYIILFVIFYGSIIYAEEGFLEHKFQTQWLEYKKKVPLIIPKRLKRIHCGDLRTSIRSERSTFLTTLIVLTLSFIKLLITR